MRHGGATYDNSGRHTQHKYGSWSQYAAPPSNCIVRLRAARHGALCDASHARVMRPWHRAQARARESGYFWCLFQVVSTGQFWCFLLDPTWQPLRFPRYRR